jgi:dihydroflavonol-4-reductase
VRAAQRGRLGDRYLLTGHNVTLRQFATLVARIAGVPPPRWRLPYPLASAAALGSEWWARLTRTEPLLTQEEIRTARTGHRLDGDKAVKELGVPQTPLEEAIRRAVRWFRQQGIIEVRLKNG